MNLRLEKHLIWDFDGTLYDTYSQIVMSMLLALNDHHLLPRPQDLFPLMKESSYYCACVCAEQYHLDKDELMREYTRYHSEQKEFGPMPGITPCLRDTMNMGCKHYLFTHRNHTALDQIYADDLNYYFTDYVTRDSGFADKPSPEGILHLMEKNGFEAKDAFMIGDRKLDMEAAKNAGVTGILYDPDGYFPQLDVPYRVKTMAEILAIMTDLAKEQAK